LITFERLEVIFFCNVVCVTLILIGTGSYQINTTETGDTLEDTVDRVTRVIAIGIIGLHYCQKITDIVNEPEQAYIHSFFFSLFG
jgi:hypothetical protein